MSDLYENQPNMVQALRQGLIRPEREGEYWTDDEREKLRRCFDEGMGITETALVLRRSEHAVVQQIEKQDLYERKNNPRRRKSPKAYVCSCSTCRAPEELCPLAKNCNVCREADENE